MRRAARIDANQPAIVDALRKIGAVVWFLRDPLDLLVGFRGHWTVLEVKDGSLPPSQRELTKREEDAIRDVDGRAPIAVVKSVDEAIKAIMGTK
jgi:hypothetical protein